MIENIHLNSLYEFTSNELVKKIKKFRKQYTKLNPCGCATDVPKNQLLNCKHMKFEINKKFKKDIDTLGKIIMEKIRREIVEHEGLNNEQKINIIKELKKM